MNYFFRRLTVTLIETALSLVPMVIGVVITIFRASWQVSDFYLEQLDRLSAWGDKKNDPNNPRRLK